jgi:hypothetical protein
MIFHHKILFQQQMNTTMMSIFDVVDLYRKIDEIHRERKVQDHQEIKHFQVIMIILNEKTKMFDSINANYTITSCFFGWKRRDRWNKSRTG